MIMYHMSIVGKQNMTGFAAAQKSSEFKMTLLRQAEDQFESSNIRTVRSFIHIDQVEISNIHTGFSVHYSNRGIRNIKRFHLI